MNHKKKQIKQKQQCYRNTHHPLKGNFFLLTRGKNDLFVICQFPDSLLWTTRTTLQYVLMLCLCTNDEKRSFGMAIDSVSLLRRALSEVCLISFSFFMLCFNFFSAKLGVCVSIITQASTSIPSTHKHTPTQKESGTVAEHKTYL